MLFRLIPNFSMNFVKDSSDKNTIMRQIPECRPKSVAKKKEKSNDFTHWTLAEGEGFEPPVPLGTVVFKTTVIDHSTISPVLRCLESGCKGTEIFWKKQILRQLFIIYLENRLFLCTFAAWFIRITSSISLVSMKSDGCWRSVASARWARRR